jgi:serine phosphatase RsbU (regulator of sigma subunit)
MASREHSLLLIDDEEIVRRRLATHLESRGYKVYQAADGEQGLLMYRELHPDVVLCDIKMPELDGFEVLKAIKAEDLGTPIIVISGVGVMGDVVNALRLGASDYLIKPILDKDVLEHAIARCIEQGRLREENLDYRRRLEQANQELQLNLKVLEQDQLVGRQVQLKMLPPTPKQFGSYHFSHRIVPSFYLSGDFVDYFSVGENHVVFFIADVSGHGASSAFVTVLLKNMFARKRSDFSHRNDNTILSPLGMLDVANRNLLNTEVGKHATLCVGVIDLVTDTLSYSVAGHLPLPILASNGQCDYLPGKGMPVGLFESAEYSENTLVLPKNFVLTLFSDGILEVLPADGLLEQEQYLLGALQEAPNTIGDIVSTLALDDVTAAPDDIAVLLISR